MITHQPHERILRHFDRLRAESGLDCYLICHNSAPVSSVPGTISVSDEAIAKVHPRRNAERVRKNHAISNGYVDLVAFTAAKDPRLAIFDYLWILEADVDFSGHWKCVFKRYRYSTADLIGSRLRTPEDDPEWWHWREMICPANAARLQLFIPAMRITKKFLRTYLRETQSGLWAGHPEAMTASIAVAHKMRIRDMYEDAIANAGTFGYRPIRSKFYFHEFRGAFGETDKLYHPVKVHVG